MSSWHVDQLKYALGVGGLVTFYGLISVIILVAGNRFGIELTYQIVIIAIVLLTLPFALVIGYFATRKKKKPEEAPDTQAAAEPQNVGADSAGENGAAPKPANLTAAPTGKYEELTTNTDTAVQFLKTSNLGGNGNAVYELPFFLFAGTPRSGKSSLVQSSGLNFQTLPNQRQSEQSFIRPTRSVDWRVSSDAVLIDTAGRYQTEGIDADEWSALFESLKKHRGNRPLDGLVLVVNTEKILNADESEIEHQAKLLRTRVDEAMQRTKVRFPVYLIFSNADAIEGFRDSFSVSQLEGKKLILGATFPLEKTDNSVALFDSEFETIQQGLQKRRLLRLSAPFPPVRQLRIFNFPAHFGATRRKLGHFVTTLFRPNPFSESPMFRGFYFTAAVPSKQAARGEGNAGGMQTVGATYFSERFFRDILLRDKDLVATFQAQQQRPPVLGWLLLFFGAIVAFLLLAVSGLSLYLNQQLLNESAERGQRVLDIIATDKGRDPLTKNPNETRAEVEAVDDLRETLVKLDNYERNGAPVYMRFGLYSGHDVYPRLLRIYAASVEQRYKKPVVKQIESDLRAFSSNQAPLNSATLTDEQEKELGRYYDLLKAYLMLSGEYKDRAEKTELTNLLADYWKKSSPSELENLSQQQLAFYASQVNRDEFPRIPLDKTLVDGVRKRLQAYPPVFRYYKRVTTDISKKIDPISVESVLAGQSAGVLEGDYKVPGAFTAEGYRKEMKRAIDLAQVELSKDDWVMGEQTSPLNTSNDDIRRLQERYFTEYTDHWRKFIRGTKVAKYNRKDDAIGALKAFSSSQSPMEILMRAVARNTNLSAKPKTTDWWSWLTGFFQSADAAKTDGNTEVEKEFKALFAFMGEEDKPDAAPVSQYRADLRKLLQNIENKTEDEFRTIAKDLTANPPKDTILLGRTESNVSNRLEAFTSAAGQEAAELLKKPLLNLRVFLGADAQNQLEKAWREQVLPKAQEIEKGYPFVDGGTEADMQKLTAYLNTANGTFSKFFTDRLEKYFEEAGGQYKVKDTSDLKFTPEFVAYLNNAMKLREAMFGKGATPNFEYEFKLQPVKDAILEAKIDSNQPLTSEGTSSAKFTFPARTGDTGAVLRFTSTAETVSTTTGTSTTPTNTSTTANANVSANVNRGGSQTNASTNSNTSAAPNALTFPGQWGLFRMFEAGAPQKQPSGEYLLTYKVGGKTVNATVRPTIGDLFDRNVFRSLKAPQTMIRQ